MQYSELMQEVKGLVFDVLRVDTDDYFEAVAKEEQLTELAAILDKFFGLPAYPTKVKLSPQIEEKIKDFGGIKPGQTLYFINQETRAIIAMLWPWSDKRHTTLKIIRRA